MSSHNEAERGEYSVAVTFSHILDFSKAKMFKDCLQSECLKVVWASW